MVQRWDIITIGNISRNRYWGETDDRAYRSAICTCTLIQTDEGRVLVDPSLEDRERMAAELNRRTGLQLGDVEAVFVTLRFDCDGLSVVVAADAAMTRDFWRERQGYFNSADFRLAARSIEELAQIGDLIIPGHDNYFPNRR